MIRYGKILKKGFYTLFISCLTLIGSSIVSADHFGDDMAGTIPYTVVYSNISNTVNSSLNFSNSSGGNWLNLPADNNYHFYVFWNNGRLYNYSYIGGRNKFYRQGYFDRACKVYSDDAFLESPRCVSDNDFTTGNAAEFYGLTNYNFTKAGVYSYDDFQYPHFCFYNANNLYYYCFKGTMIDGNSLSIPDGTTSFSAYAGNSKFGNGTEINTNTPNNNYTCPTIRQLMQSMGNNYNTGLCYNNTNYYNGTNFEQIEKQDIFTIFNDDYENYTNRISIYRNNCNAPATSQNCGNAFSGEFKKFSIISNAINSKVDEKNLWNYCNLGLNFDPNATTCTLNGSGIIKEDYTTEEEIQYIIDHSTIPTPKINSGDDNVINILNDCESGDRDCYLNNWNFIESLSNIYGKITGLFKERKNVNGIIPEYILRITFITILFTVIFKK